MRNRYYNPSIGRFINEDPIRDGGNWYSYANGNPVRFNDPTGWEHDEVNKIVKSCGDAISAETTVTRHNDDGYVTYRIKKDGEYDYSMDVRYDGTVLTGRYAGQKLFYLHKGRLEGSRTYVYRAMGINTTENVQEKNYTGLEMLKDDIDIYANSHNVAQIMVDSYAIAMSGKGIGLTVVKMIAENNYFNKGTYYKKSTTGTIILENSNSKIYVTTTEYQDGSREANKKLTMLSEPEVLYTGIIF